MPAHRKPVAHLKLTGGYRPDRHKPLPAASTSIGDPPAHLSPELAELWKELAADLRPGVAAASDRIAFELLVSMTATMRTGRMTAAQTTSLTGLLNRFGMTPAGRLQLGIPEQEPPPDPDKPLTGLASFR